jgi:Skp family chaperone for outer membrane proteins
MIRKKAILAAALAAPATLVFAAPAQAQVSGIAYANPTTVVAGSKAFAAANQQISTTYKSAFDQIKQRREALQKEAEPLLTQLDTNKDKQISDAEVQAAQAAKNPVLDRLRDAQSKGETEIARLTNPAARAELFAIESILRQYEAAQLRVVNARKINVVLSPEVFMYAPDSANISQAITAEIDRTTPTVGIQPPANWQPSRETVAVQQQLAQLAQIRAYQQAAQARAQQPAAGTAPAAPAGAPAAGATQPARPAEPR